jgi:hypothetical protein
VGARAEKWREQVEPHFRYLEGHGYRLVHSDDESWWETVVRYESSVNAVLVKLSVEFHRVEVELARLDYAELPPVEPWIGPYPSGGALLENVLVARDPQRARGKPLNGIGRAATARALTFWASVLREVCPDFLGGSDNCLSEAHALVWDRGKEKPQVLTLHLPSTASLDEEAAAVANARAETPEHVNVEVVRYHRPGRQ